MRAYSAGRRRGFFSHRTTPPSFLTLTPPTHTHKHTESQIPEPDLANPECYTLTTHDQQFGSDPIPMQVRMEAG